MSIRMMCDASAPGAYPTKYGEHELFMHETHTGLVLDTGEVNGYDDSDFYAVVWNPETKAPERVTYASTRGWTYPNGATVDATDEVRAAYKEYCAERIRAERERVAKREAATPVVGRNVRVIHSYHSRKGDTAVLVGETGKVFWFGEDRFARPSRYGSALFNHLKDPREGKRIGIELSDGRKVFLNATKVEVINEEAAA